MDVPKRTLYLPEIGFIAATRAMVGAGLALVLSDRLTREQRKSVGWTLLSIGAVTTIPIGLRLLAGEHHQLNTEPQL